MITQNELKRLFDYNPITGNFIFKVKTGKKVIVGTIAGTKSGDYTIIRVDGKRYRAHHLAWLYVYGNLPTDIIDHINGNGRDNSIANLRECSQKQNCENKGGVSGYYYDKARNKFQAKIKNNYKTVFLGRFDTEEEARQAYINAKKQHHLFNPELRDD
jgi:hypothetical protein